VTVLQASAPPPGGSTYDFFEGEARQGRVMPDFPLVKREQEKI
jgi:hypothetical protein